jgi:hypothetical protein
MLPIIGKDKVGFGFLVENCGYVSPKDNKKFINEIESKNVQSFADTPVLYAVMQKYGIENGNGRVYPESILKREVENYKKLIAIGASAGEADHPESVSISTQNIALQVIDLWWEGATLMGKIKLPLSRGFIEQGIISCPADLMANHILNGIQLGVSSRGIGSVKNINNQKIVQDDFELLCWDMVTTPSTNGSWAYADKSKTTQHIQHKVEEKKVSNTYDKLDNLSGISKAMSNFLDFYK